MCATRLVSFLIDPVTQFATEAVCQASQCSHQRSSVTGSERTSSEISSSALSAMTLPRKTGASVGPETSSGSRTVPVGARMCTPDPKITATEEPDEVRVGAEEEDRHPGPTGKPEYGREGSRLRGSPPGPESPGVSTIRPRASVSTRATAAFDPLARPIH